MGGIADVRSLDALERMHAALKTFGSDAMEALGSAERAIQASLEWVLERYRHWQSQVDVWTEEVASALSVLAFCMSDTDDEGRGRDCSREEERVAEARRRLRNAEEQMAIAGQWSDRVSEAAQEYRQEAARVQQTLGEAVGKGGAFLSSASASLQSYVSTSPGASGAASIGAAIGAAFSGAAALAGGGGASGDEPSARSPAQGVAPRALQWVSLSQIDLNDCHVKGSADYQKVPYPVVVQGLHRLHETVAPAVSRGAGLEYFRQMDARMGLSYQDGYAAIYEAYYSPTSAILLDSTPTGFAVVNGYHRIMAALWEGYHDLPVFIRR